MLDCSPQGRRLAVRRRPDAASLHARARRLVGYAPASGAAEARGPACGNSTEPTLDRAGALANRFSFRAAARNKRQQIERGRLLSLARLWQIRAAALRVGCGLFFF